jgi:hypothetical protein
MKKMFLSCMFLIFTASLFAVEGKLLDFWDEAPRLFNSVAEGDNVDRDMDRRNQFNYKPAAFSCDRSDFKVGDFSVVYTVAKSAHKPVFGFSSSLWGKTWKLNKNMSLKFFVKVSGEKTTDKWDVVFVDETGKKAVGTIDGVGFEKWQEVSLKLSALKPEDGFNWNSVKLCQFKAAFSADSKVWFDGVRFETDNGNIIGVTDKPLSQWMNEAEDTREIRIDKAMSDTARKDAFDVVSAFAKMYLNQDLDAANKTLVEELKKSDEGNAWSLLHTPLYCRFYYNFSNRAGKYPGRMTPETEKLLLETLWNRTVDKNDIHWSKQSTWWMDGSENHDLNAKACNLVTSRIFMNEPEYKDRIYPDHGYGGAYHYGHAGYYGTGVDPDRHGGGRAELADGKQYNAADHYEAWLAYIKEYFSERARRGFYLERAAPGYTHHTFNFVELAYTYSGDKELEGIIDDFMDVFWADCAQESIGTIRGGPKTRHHYKVGSAADGVHGFVEFQLGGPGNGACWWYYNMINDYRMPAVVWAMSIDRQGMGCFEYKSRGIGEEQNIWPRPLGQERAMLCDTDSRFLKYSYVTPDYILSTQMDHPAAVHSHLSVAGRWHGMVFGESDAARIVPVGLPSVDAKTKKKSQVDMEMMYKTAQYKNTLIVQQSRNYNVVHPTWYPSYYGRHEKPMGVWLGNDWDKLVEKNGWVFVQKGNAYGAVRVVLWDEEYEKQKKKEVAEGNQKFFHGANDDPTVKLSEDCYSWDEDHTIIEFKNIFSPVIIEAGRKADYPSLDEFMADVLDNPIALYKTVVPGFDILVYTGCGKDAPEIEFNGANNAIPTFNREYINYGYPMTFDSPYMKSAYKSGVVDLDFAGMHKRNVFRFKR